MPYLPEAKTEALKAIPGAATLLRVFAEKPGTYLVGGAVRDLMLGFAQFDYDLMVEGDAEAAAQLLASEVGGEIRVHERFLTATFVSEDRSLSVDVAQARTESYAAPGALPDVTPADAEDDLARRDFTINAMALAIWHDRLGELTTFPGANEDLLARLLRVTHDQSFIDDPTRLFRLLRYGARLGFTAEPHTEELARVAVEGGAVDTISGARLRDVLLPLLAERSAVVAVEAMCALGLDRAMHAKFDADEYVVARALNEQFEGVRQDLLLLALCCRAMDSSSLAQWLERLKLTRGDARVVIESVGESPELLKRVAAAGSAADVDGLLRPLAVETLICALALPRSDREAGATVRSWLEQRNSGHLAINGADLRAAGVGEGPQIGRALAATLNATLNGEIEGREAQLEFALADARQSGEIDV